LKAPYKMAASSKDKRTPITTPSYKVPSVDVTPDLPTFWSLTLSNLNDQCGCTAVKSGIYALKKFPQCVKKEQQVLKTTQ